MCLKSLMLLNIYIQSESFTESIKKKKYFEIIFFFFSSLKLGNLFLNDALEIKIGDFGLATKLEFDGEKKRYKLEK